ncbi:DDE_3 domain-containing protein [Trichonephila clavipes]|nr:DDE_3 domain-containing protein [Trichonephila clavipes]
MLDGRTPLYIFDTGSIAAQRYKDQVLKPHVKLFRGAIDQANSPDLNSIAYVWDALGLAIAQLQYPPNMFQMLKSALIEEWGLLP